MPEEARTLRCNLASTDDRERLTKDSRGEGMGAASSIASASGKRLAHSASTSYRGAHPSRRARCARDRAFVPFATIASCKGWM